MHEALKNELIETDDAFRDLYEQHQACELELEEIVQRSFPSQDDETQIKRIKMRKLALKDQMESILVMHEREAVAAHA